ncbi:lipoprotein-releasing ABC transporter permease subunit [Leucothrix pacifica]|uniref:Lipoprotein-releasing ABC transporter permease subunit n=1 Tax=Leucothrix pacifica TaxID=1247513 RepID=A0A317CQ62_9GAMM|nr:lipoprotein-releasing ABC transporter permease subunit [Leucothrix pacifica]PWR00338.1 lipoprotein-releasing ABC transporter permease subunit [Leucothrix pacifica]
MFQPLEAAIGLRYTRARREKSFVSFISFASMIGIALGVIVLITVLSVMNGFEQAMRDRILGVLSHVTVSETDAQVANWQQRREELLKLEHVVAAAPFVEKQVMLNEGGSVQGAILEGVLPEFEKQTGNVSQHMMEGKGSFDQLVAGENNIILGVKLAESLKVDVGDSVTLLTPTAGADLGEIPILKQFNITGIFRVDLQQYDQGTVFVHMEDAASLFEMGDQVTGVRLRLNDLYKSRVVSDQVAATSGTDYWVSDWTRQNENFFKAIQLQKTMMFFLLGLIIAVAAFNLVSTLVMVVTDKGSDIAIFRTLGMTPRNVMKVFMVQGTLIGVIGTILGVIFGVLLAVNVDVIVPFLERIFNVNFISEDVYGISTLESVVRFSDVALIAIAALVLSMLATLYPSWKASRVQPAEALRYE